METFLVTLSNETIFYALRKQLEINTSKNLRFVLSFTHSLCITAKLQGAES